MDKMFSVSELSKITRIPESTVRRYISKFEAYFQYDSRGKGKKYHSESVEVLKRIAGLYSEDYQAHEIESVLATQFSFTVTDQQDTTTQPPVTIERQLQEFRDQQAEFNKQLLEKLEQQEQYIKKLLEERNQPLLQKSETMQPEEKEDAAEAVRPKKWWRFWK
ncbi:MAG: helix-turn-helix domain-containing protein [Carnobacterium alterfunditum]